MKRFLYTRLKERSKDYRFYIPPGGDAGLLLNAISSDLLSSERRLLFLQNYNGTISFGVRGRIGFFDSSGADICNFIGYEVNANEGIACVPSFKDFHEKFDAIAEEARACHRQLNENSDQGKNLKETEILFGNGDLDLGNAWDQAVIQIGENPNRPVLLMFDDAGNSLNLDLPYKTQEQTSRNTYHVSNYPKKDGNLRVPATYPAPEVNNIGIVSSVTLNPSDIKAVPPLKHYDSFGGSICQKFWRLVTLWRKEDNPKKRQHSFFSGYDL